MTKLINYTLYQIGWFCCVLGAANGRPWSGMAAAFPFLLWLTARWSGSESPGGYRGLSARVA